MPAEPGVGGLGDLVVTTGDGTGVVPSCDARVRVTEPVRGDHDAVPVGDPRTVRGPEIMRGDVDQPDRAYQQTLSCQFELDMN